MNSGLLLQLRRKVDLNLHILGELEDELASIDAGLELEKKKVDNYTEATRILREIYKATQERFHGQIEKIVTHCLREVFGEDAYNFHIKFEERNNRVEASFIFERNGVELTDPLNNLGGGIIAVACFALRLSVIYFMQRSTRRIMILDEPFSQLSVEYRPAMANLLYDLVGKFDFQFIIITHADEFNLGRVYSIVNGKIKEVGLSVQPGM